MYDVIIVGARVAGSSTALLLARKGYRVLLVDRATFPSDTLSTHQIQIPGGAALKRWGLLDRVLATNPGAARHVRFDLGQVVLDGKFPSLDGVDAVYSPRRYLLDKILIDAAVEAGAELRESFITEDLHWEEGRVVGISGRLTNGGTMSERARMVVGADGRRSLVAERVNAPKYDEVAPLTCAYYSYFENVPLAGGEIYGRGKRFIGLWPTNNQLTMLYMCWPVVEFNTFRADVEGNYMATLDLVPAVAERVRAGQRAERIMGTADLANFYRKPYGSGWALVGDAGYSKDPVSAMGISDAFRDAELLAEALDAGVAGKRSPEVAMAEYEQERNAASKPAYDFTLETARMNPPSAVQIELLKALEHNPAATRQFFGMMTGLIQPTKFFTPQNLFRILKARGMAKIMLKGILPAPQRRAS